MILCFAVSKNRKEDFVFSGSTGELGADQSRLSRLAVYLPWSLFKVAVLTRGGVEG